MSPRAASTRAPVAGSYPPQPRARSPARAGDASAAPWRPRVVWPRSPPDRGRDTRRAARAPAIGPAIATHRVSPLAGIRRSSGTAPGHPRPRPLTGSACGPGAPGSMPCRAGRTTARAALPRALTLTDARSSDRPQHRRRPITAAAYIHESRGNPGVLLEHAGDFALEAVHAAELAEERPQRIRAKLMQMAHEPAEPERGG